MRTHWIVAVLGVVLAFPIFAGGQTSPSGGAPLTCGVELSELHVSERGYHLLSVQIKNTSGKRIVGLVFNAALSDATERWKWLHWNYDLTRPLQDIGWNKPVKQGESKRLSWDYDLEREHGGGVALVLTSVLFADGTRWEEDVDSATCKQIWYHNHKKGFTRPIELPRRE
ncbi:MAG TPA: hypothetical protein VGK36_15230 [Candidatus Angelobacter sp.]|jgi:hypothetical protein